MFLTYEDIFIKKIKHAVIQCYTISSIIVIGHTSSKSINIEFRQYYMFPITL